MRARRLATILALLVLLLGGLLVAAPRPAAAQGEVCFQETGSCVRGRFLDYWTANGGLARNGFPLSEERQELLEDGKTYTVQYFERVRLEYHPENAAPYDVLLGQFGRRVARTGTLRGGPASTAPADPNPAQTYFAETGHNLGGRFLQYWRVNGDLAQFGYPITEEIRELLEDGNIYTVQYFERARLELHPENQAPYDVLLGQFGRQILAENTILASDPGFQRLYVPSVRAQEQLGFVGNAPVLSTTGAYQGFEHGAMIYRSDVRGIYVFCGDAQAGRVPSWGPRGQGYLPDTWSEGEDQGGGAGPAAGLYQPRRGFGKLWRENQGVRDCLGYATQPEETSSLRLLAFARGYLLSAATPTGRFVYALYIAGADRRYERYPDPTP